MDIIVRGERGLAQIKFLEFDTIIFMDLLYEEESYLIIGAAITVHYLQLLPNIRLKY